MCLITPTTLIYVVFGSRTMHRVRQFMEHLQNLLQTPVASIFQEIPELL